VLFHDLSSHRLECPQANVQGNVSSFNAALFEPRKDFGSEVQTSGGRRD
jgi:hypothetical protein